MIRTRDLATGGIVAVLAIASAVYASQLPSELAVQFDSAGEPNSFVQAELFLTGNVLLVAGVAVLFAVLPRVDPLGENVTEFQTAYDGFAVATVAFVGYIHGLVIAYNLGYEFGMLEATVPATAALYLLLGPLLYRAEKTGSLVSARPGHSATSGSGDRHTDTLRRCLCLPVCWRWVV